MGRKLPPRDGPSMRRIDIPEETPFMKNLKLGLLILMVPVLLGIIFALFPYLPRLKHQDPTLSDQPLASDPKAYDPVVF